MSQSKRKQLVAEARRIAQQADSWIALSNALTDPNGGLIARYYPDTAQRQEFLLSPEYEQLNQMLHQLIDRNGLYPSRKKTGSATAG